MEGMSQLYGVELFCSCHRGSIRAGTLEIWRLASWGAKAQLSQNSDPTVIKPEPSSLQNQDNVFSQTASILQQCQATLSECSCPPSSYQHLWHLLWRQGKRGLPAPLAARLSEVRCFWTGEGVQLHPLCLNAAAILQHWRWRLAA